MIKHYISGMLVAAVMVSYMAVPSYAVTTPSFPSCLNPQGELKVKYDNGTHGIVGDQGTYTGSDAVYRTSEQNAVQCYCSTNGSGIQTNWWYAENMSDEDIKAMTYAGWHLVYDGSQWGLSSGKYLAQNSSYSCLAGNGGGSNGGSSSGSSSSSSSSDSDPGTVLGIGGGDILGLASTGNVSLMYLLVTAGIISVTAGLLLEKKLTEERK